MVTKHNLNKLRKEIDKIDSRILQLINSRAKVSCKIGHTKKKEKLPLYSPERESRIAARVEKENTGPLTADSANAIYREIMSACLSLEQPMTVAYLGPELTFTHQAAMKKFGSSAKYLSCDVISDVFYAVEKENADYGVVPVENSTEGAVNYTLDMFVDSPLLICSEIYHSVRHSLLAVKKNVKGIKKIYSNPQVFGQCRAWIEKNLPLAELHGVASTAKAAEMASKRSDAACIASEMAAKKYCLKVLVRSIQDKAANVTRFLIVGKQTSGISGRDKTSVVFSVKDKPGVLHDVLKPFKNNGINLTKIESRPSKRKLWKYYFFVDMEGHRETQKVKKALKMLKQKCYFVKILGSYPKG